VNPQISVITPTFRRPKYLLALAQHMLNQHGVRFEHVIVSDGPDRQNYAVVKSYRERASFPVVYHEQEHKGGYGTFARTTGQKLAKGDYFVYFDDDNVFYPHALATLYAAAYGHVAGTALLEHWDYGVPTGRYVGDRVECGHIDAGCFCVRRDAALRVVWENTTDDLYTGDYYFIAAVTRGIVNHVPVVIGSHMIEGPRVR